tara:strand:- start:130 stop:1392 length:1263 start_codon:yes stop_codon:yes gene_type:complete
VELVDAPHSKCGTFGFVGSSPTAPTVLMGTYERYPITLTRGKGTWVWDQNNKKYLDAVAGIATCSLGHSNKALRNALQKQLKKIQHVSNLYQIPEQEALGQWLVDQSCADSVFFCNSGAEANEAAIKLARKHGHINRGIDRPIILTAKQSFHGRTLAAISATGQPKYHKGFEPVVEGFAFFSYNNWESFKKLFHQLESEGPKVAAVLIEPLQGEGGIHVGDKTFFKKVKDLCSQNGVLLIFDEVQSGMGRTGYLWAYEHLSIEPDAFTLAKGLGGGHAIGALLAKKNADLFETGDHASTFGGNPFACKAGLTVGKEIQRQNLLSQVTERGEQLRKGLNQIINDFPNQLQEVRGLGLIQGLVIKETSSLTSQEITNAAIHNQLLVVSAGPKVVRMVPPLIIKKNEIAELLKRLKASLINCS